jgi:hypothetical protein
VDKPDRQATTLNMYEILDLEFLAITATHYADRVGAALFRFTLGCCARFDDTKHTSLKSFADNEHTLEFTNTQTKTTGPTKKRHTIPLIAPKIDFHEIHRNMPITEATKAFHTHGPPTFSAESNPWWSTLLTYRHDTPPDSKRDYLFAIPTHDKRDFSDAHSATAKPTRGSNSSPPWATNAEDPFHPQNGSNNSTSTASAPPYQT